MSAPVLSYPLVTVQADVQERVRNNTQFERFCLWMNSKCGLSNSFGGNAISRRGELQRFSAVGQGSISMSVARHHAMHLVANRDSPNSLSDAELCLSLKMGLDIPAEHQVILNGQFSLDRPGQAHSVRPNTFCNYPLLVETLETLFGSSREWYPYPGSCLFKCDAPKGQTDSQGDVIMSGFFSKGSSRGNERKQGEEQRKKPKNKTKNEEPKKKKKKLCERKFNNKGAAYVVEHDTSDSSAEDYHSSEDAGNRLSGGEKSSGGWFENVWCCVVEKAGGKKKEVQDEVEVESKYCLLSLSRGLRDKFPVVLDTARTLSCVGSETASEYARAAPNAVVSENAAGVTFRFAGGAKKRTTTTLTTPGVQVPLYILPDSDSPFLVGSDYLGSCILDGPRRVCALPSGREISLTLDKGLFRAPGHKLFPPASDRAVFPEPELAVDAEAVCDTQNLEFGGIRYELVFARDHDMVKKNFATDS